MYYANARLRSKDNRLGKNPHILADTGLYVPNFNFDLSDKMTKLKSLYGRMPDLLSVNLTFTYLTKAFEMLFIQIKPGTRENLGS